MSVASSHADERASQIREHGASAGQRIVAFLHSSSLSHWMSSGTTGSGSGNDTPKHARHPLQYRLPSPGVDGQLIVIASPPGLSPIIDTSHVPCSGQKISA